MHAAAIGEGGRDDSKSHHHSGSLNLPRLTRNAIRVLETAGRLDASSQGSERSVGLKNFCKPSEETQQAVGGGIADGDVGF